MTARVARRRLRVDPAYDAAFARSSRAHEVLGAGILAAAAGWADWPLVSAYDAWAAPLRRAAGRPLAFADVPRADVMACGGYDPFIRETGTIPTRSRSWHDFFNACIWGRWPHAKLALHAAQLHEFQTRPGPARSRRQDWLTHLDECGVLVASDRPQLLECVAALDWQLLFVAKRAEFERHARVYCFGHATLEALRDPYVGLMGKALLWHDPLAMSGPLEGALARADAWLAAQIQAPTPPPLRALPVLGLPGWHAPNESPSFYAHPVYFRTRPSGRPEGSEGGGDHGGDLAADP